MNYLIRRRTTGMIILCTFLLCSFYSCKNGLELDGPIVIVSGLPDHYWAERSVRIVLSDMDGNILEEEGPENWVPEVALGEDIADGLKVDLFQVHVVTISENAGNEDLLRLISFTDLEPGSTILFPESETYNYIPGDSTTVSIFNDSQELPDHYLSVINGFSRFSFEEMPLVPAPGEALDAKGTVAPGNSSNILSTIYQLNGGKDYYWLYKENVPSLSTDTFLISSYNKITTPENLPLINNTPPQVSSFIIGGFQGENYYNLYEGRSTLAEPEYYLPEVPFNSYRVSVKSNFRDDEIPKEKTILRYESNFTPFVEYSNDFLSDVEAFNGGYKFKSLTNTNGIVGYLGAKTDDLEFYWRVISPGKEGRSRVVLPPLFEHWATEFDWGPGIPMTVFTVKSCKVTGIGNFLEFITYHLSRRNVRIRYNNPGYKEETMSISLQ